MRVWICGECRLTGRRNFDIVRVSEIVLGGLSRIADSSWCGKASSWRRIAAGLSEKIRWKEVKNRQKGILWQRRAESLVLKSGDRRRGDEVWWCYCARVGIFWTEKSVQYSGGSGFFRFGMRSISKISCCLRKAWTLTWWWRKSRTEWEETVDFLQGLYYD